MYFDFTETSGGYLTTIGYAEQKTSEELNGYVTKNVGENVGEKRVEKILNEIRANNRISAKEISKKLSVAERTIERDIEKLRNYGILQRIGGDKGGYWQITKP